MTTEIEKADLTKKLNEFAIIKSDFMENMNEIVETNMGAGGFSVGDLPRISIPTGGAMSWTLATLEGRKSMEVLECVIVHFEDQRIFWAESYDQSGGDSGPPDCLSVGDNFKNKVGVGEPGGNCEQCPNYQWGSKGGGRRGKACSETRSLFLVFPDNILPVVLRLSPTSVGAARKNFFTPLVGVGKKYCDVLARIALKPGKGSGPKYSVVDFSIAGVLPEEYRVKVAAYADALRPHLTPTASSPSGGDEPF